MTLVDKGAVPSQYQTVPLQEVHWMVYQPRGEGSNVIVRHCVCMSPSDLAVQLRLLADDLDIENELREIANGEAP